MKRVTWPHRPSSGYRPASRSCRAIPLNAAVHLCASDVVLGGCRSRKGRVANALGTARSGSGSQAHFDRVHCGASRARRGRWLCDTLAAWRKSRVCTRRSACGSTTLSCGGQGRRRLVPRYHGAEFGDPIAVGSRGAHGTPTQSHPWCSVTLDFTSTPKVTVRHVVVA